MFEGDEAGGVFVHCAGVRHGRCGGGGWAGVGASEGESWGSEGWGCGDSECFE